MDMKIRAIIFDKDGTLLDFDAFWISVAVAAVSDILKAVNADASLADECLAAIGTDGKTAAPDGILCKGTYAQMTDAFCDVLKKTNSCIECDTLNTVVIKAFHDNISQGKVIPACNDITDVFKRLEKMGIKTAVVTTDDRYITEKCLDLLGIKDFFCRIYTDDGIHPTKPNPYYIKQFCSDEGLERGEILMVGDTLTDITFAENGGIKSMGVSKTDEGKQLLLSKANFVADDISQIFDVINSMETDTI